MKNFNILIAGAGGQGLITLVDILSKAALIEGLDVVSSELHGLSQRGGAVAVFVSTNNKKVYSPLFKSADLILGLELLEGLRGTDFLKEETKVVINDYYLPFIGIISKEEILKKLKKCKNLQIVKASEICKEEFGKDILAGMYLLGYLSHNNLIPISIKSLIKATEEVVPEKLLEVNKKAILEATKK